MFQIEQTARQLCGQGILVSLGRCLSASDGFGSGVGVVLEEALALTATEATQLQL